MAVTFVTREQLEAFKIVKDILPTLWGEEVVLFSTNTECFDSMYTPAAFTTYTAKVGDRLAEGSGGKLCVTSGKPVDRLVPKEVYGFPFRTIALPVLEDGGTIGSVAVARSREKPNLITEVADSLSATSQQFSASVQQMADYAEGTVSAMAALDEAVKTLLSDVKTIEEMNAVIQNIASQTNLLALNAAIEAARAGGAGRGFAVVADEVKKLSVNSVEAVKKIGQVLVEVQRSIDNVSAKIGETIAATESQARTTRELDGAMSGVVAGASRLHEVSKTI